MCARLLAGGARLAVVVNGPLRAKFIFHCAAEAGLGHRPDCVCAVFSSDRLAWYVPRPVITAARCCRSRSPAAYN